MRSAASHGPVEGPANETEVDGVMRLQDAEWLRFSGLEWDLRSLRHWSQSTKGLRWRGSNTCLVMEASLLSQAEKRFDTSHSIFLHPRDAGTSSSIELPVAHQFSPFLTDQEVG